MTAYLLLADIAFGWRYVSELDCFLLRRDGVTVARVLHRDGAWHGDVNAALVGDGLGFQRRRSGGTFPDVLGAMTLVVHDIEAARRDALPTDIVGTVGGAT